MLAKGRLDLIRRLKVLIRLSGVLLYFRNVNKLLYCSQRSFQTVYLAVLSLRPFVLRPTCVPGKKGRK